ncbi:MAG: cupin domain-containing protein [Chloroflexota bacterium]
METLIKVHESEEKYRFDDISGPKYLLRGPRSDFGLVVLMPGEDFPTHYHRKIEENFFTLEGSAEIYIKDQHLELKPGDLLHIPPLHPHYLINRGNVPWKAVFVKAPYDTKDKGDLDWVPGDPPMPDVS